MPLTTTQTISFHDIVPGGEVRFVVIDGKQYLSARDVIMCVCGVDNNDAGKKWRRLSPQHKQELKPFLAAHQFSGRGQSVQPVLTFEGSVKLLMWLPGKHAKDVRDVAANIMARYCRGDASLHPEICHNTQERTVDVCVSLIASSVHERKRQELTSMPRSGWVYGTQSEAFPSLKIGRATSLKERISSGNTFCAPAKHVVVAAVPSFHPTRDERAAHAFFADQRAEGEFFHVTRQQVQSFFDECIMPRYQRELSEALARLQT